jgi:hypothetical protein
MANFNVAHINEQGFNLIIVPLESSFDSKNLSAQNAFQNSLQACAKKAKLSGTIVLVWLNSFGQMQFLAPQNFHGFFQSIDMDFVKYNINTQLTCG